MDSFNFAVLVDYEFNLQFILLYFSLLNHECGISRKKDQNSEHREKLSSTTPWKWMTLAAEEVPELHDCSRDYWGFTRPARPTRGGEGDAAVLEVTKVWWRCHRIFGGDEQVGGRLLGRQDRSPSSSRTHSSTLLVSNGDSAVTVLFKYLA